MLCFSSTAFSESTKNLQLMTIILWILSHCNLFNFFFPEKPLKWGTPTRADIVTFTWVSIRYCWENLEHNKIHAVTSDQPGAQNAILQTYKVWPLHMSHLAPPPPIQEPLLQTPVHTLYHSPADYICTSFSFINSVYRCFLTRSLWSFVTVCI